MKEILYSHICRTVPSKCYSWVQVDFYWSPMKLEELGWICLLEYKQHSTQSILCFCLKAIQC